MRVADLVVDFLGTLGIDTVFTVTGGGAMFLDDALAQSPTMKTICNHHEQASAMAAVGYAKLRGSYSAVMTTSGCGATNAITGLLDAYQDSVPVIFISGNVKKKECSIFSETITALRQVGVQEVNIISIVRPLTKYASCVGDAKDILATLQHAAFLAREGRPGPVWIDIPLDIQATEVDLETLARFLPYEHDWKNRRVPFIDSTDFGAFINQYLAVATRPVIIAGGGIRSANAEKEFKALVEQLKIPVAVSYLGVDLLPSDHPQYVGRLGIKGDRAGNFAVANADLVIVIGCRLSVALTGFDYAAFARKAKIVVIDIDKEEHNKNTVRVDKVIEADIKEFINRLLPLNVPFRWLSWGMICRQWRDQWPVCLAEYEDDSKGINMYKVVDRVSHFLKHDSVVVADAGSAYYVTSQTLKIKDQQRYITSGAQADMGFALPAAIGCCIAAPQAAVIAITGDGSLQMNVQELQTIKHHNLNLKLVVLNNEGYLSIRATQKKFFNGREFGTDAKSGVSFPDLSSLARAYRLDYFKVETIRQLNFALSFSIGEKEHPTIIEVICPRDQEVIPSASSMKLADGSMISKPLEDMYPFLDREVFLSNMIIPPLEGDSK